MVYIPYRDLPELEKEKKRRYNSEWAKTKKGKLVERRSKLKWKYGITQEQYDELLISQGGRCALCSEDQRPRKLCVDHDHKTGLVRGLLCSIHNTSIGNLGDDEQGILKALKYLRRGHVQKTAQAA